MDGSYPISNLRLWEGPITALAQDAPAASVDAPPNPADYASRLFASEALDPPATVLRLAAPAEPYTLQWFLNIESERHGRHGRWIPRLLEFAKHSGETMLGLGDGLGTDWLQYARHGASVVACSPSASQLALIRRNFELRGLAGRFIRAPAHCLPLQSASIDVACLSSFPHTAESARPVLDEVYRVLKPGGKVLTVAPAKYDVHYLTQKLCFWQRWTGVRYDLTMEPVTRYSVRGLRRLFGRFAEHRIRKRQLRAL